MRIGDMVTVEFKGTIEAMRLDKYTGRMEYTVVGNNGRAIVPKEYLTPVVTPEILKEQEEK